MDLPSYFPVWKQIHVMKGHCVHDWAHMCMSKQDRSKTDSFWISAIPCGNKTLSDERRFSVQVCVRAFVCAHQRACACARLRSCNLHPFEACQPLLSPDSDYRKTFCVRLRIQSGSDLFELLLPQHEACSLQKPQSMSNHFRGRSACEATLLAGTCGHAYACRLRHARSIH